MVKCMGGNERGLWGYLGRAQQDHECDFVGSGLLVFSFITSPTTLVAPAVPGSTSFVMSVSSECVVVVWFVALA